MNVMEMLEKEQMRGDIPDFNTGDTIKVFVRIVEGQKQRIQAFEGVVIRRRRGDVRSSFTVRKISYGVGVERTFPLHSPSIDRIEVVTRGKVRRSRLYYLRSLRGKQARIKEAGKVGYLPAGSPPQRHRGGGARAVRGMNSFEGKARGRGYRMIAGIDEAGRGPLAGPVIAAAVILPPGYEHPEITDSKKLSPRQRERLYEVIQRDAVSDRHRRHRGAR